MSHLKSDVIFVDTDFSMQALKIGPPGGAPWHKRSMRFVPLPTLTEGLRVTTPRRPPLLPDATYSLYISVGTETGQPTIELPLAPGDGFKRYCLGSLVVSSVSSGTSSTSTSSQAREDPAR